jgi:predicted TIM-barrel fold metal-dependent hydrolase
MAGGATWAAGGTGAPAAAPGQAESASGTPCPLALTEFEPKSMLRVAETLVPKARFPVVDFHTHLSFVHDEGTPVCRHLTTPEEALVVMDRKNVTVMVNLTGGYGPALEESLRYWHRSYPDRFLVFVEPWYNRIREAGYAQLLADEVEKAAELGARGLKVLKTLGLYLREQVSEGPLVRVDDPRFDPMWEACGGRSLPVAIHTSDPLAFFLPIDRYNERFEELNAHPDWSFHGKDFPSDRELQEARMRVVQRHPRTIFVGLHVAVAEDLDYVSDCMRRCPNFWVEIGARIGELGRQPRRARRFFAEFQDRILFGTDAVPGGVDTPQQIFGDRIYEIYYRFLETEDEHFDYAPAPIPPQGRWRIYGLGLPEPILRKVYYENAARLLKLPI